MRTMHVLTDNEVNKAKARLKQLKWLALMNRDVGDNESNRECYLKAKGFEEALTILGIIVDK